MSRVIDSLRILNKLSVGSDTSSVSSVTGALTMSGGMGVGKDLFCNGLTCNGRISGKVRTTAVDMNLANDYILNVTAAAFITLPDITDSAYDGVTYFVMKSPGVFTVTIDTQTLDKISYGGSLVDSITLNNSDGDNTTIISDGVYWHMKKTLTTSATNEPTSVVATAGTRNASVSFVEPTNNGGVDILYYIVTSSPGGFTSIGTSSPVIVTGLSAVSYTFTVSAINEAGVGTASSASNAVTPVVPVVPS